LATVLVIVAACGAPASPPVKAAPRAHEVFPDAPFDQLDHDQRALLMKTRIIPTMAPLFAGHVAELGCKTCHGSQVEKGRYTMPNRELPAIGEDLSRFKRADVEWMTDLITPTMGKLLARSALDCATCHPTE
jgi:hypothetical protein